MTFGFRDLMAWRAGVSAVVFSLAMASPLSARDDSPLRILVVCAQPADCVVGAGGAAVTWIARGYQVLFANVTATYQAVGDQETELRMRRRMEANAAARHLGVKLLVIEDPSGDIPSATRLRDELASLVKTTHPDVVVLPRGSAASLDVSMGMKSALSSAFSAPVAEATSRARQPVCLYYMDQAQAELPETNLVVPIDDVMDQKTSALSEFRAFPTTTYSPSRTDSRALPVPLPTRTSIPLPLQAWVDAGAGAPRSDAEKALVVRLYGEAAVAGIQHLESFGYDDDSQPEESTVRKLTRSSVKP